tara:strand:+ start:21409 stop:21627 length:219 start_codon:yes stop_codon:yes gene_type:complete
MRWEVKDMEDGKWGIYLCEEFWKYPDKPVCYGASTNKSVAIEAVEWKNKAEEELEANPESQDYEDVVSEGDE